MNLYISDLHFGHSKIIPFDKRPFADVDEMDRIMIERWNDCVRNEDDVYIVGDFSFMSRHPDDWYLEQLKGHKHLIVGNHDEPLLRNEKAMAYIESADKMQQVADGDKQVVLCHFPLAEWDREAFGSWLIYGHLHAKKDEVYEFMKTKKRALNASACINGYTPASFEELVSANEIFQREQD